MAVFLLHSCFRSDELANDAAHSGVKKQMETTEKTMRQSEERARDFSNLTQTTVYTTQSGLFDKHSLYACINAP